MVGAVLELSSSWVSSASSSSSQKPLFPVILDFRVGLCCCLFLPRFRDLSSSFAKSNDRRSCHGAHGMGGKKSFP